jgi:hypothetical protein
MYTDGVQAWLVEFFHERYLVGLIATCASSLFRILQLAITAKDSLAIERLEGLSAAIQCHCEATVGSSESRNPKLYSFGDDYFTISKAEIMLTAIY